MIETTLVVFKPDSIQRGLVGMILSRFEQKGLKIRGLKILQLDASFARGHYAEHKGKPFLDHLVDFMTSGPVIAIALEGLGSIQVCRRLIGPTDGLVADPGTIRGDFAQFKRFNLVHASDSVSSAARELKLWFRDGELINYKKDSDKWLF